MPDVPVAPLTDTERAAFWDVPEENLRRSPIDARHYVQSNEPRHSWWFPFIDGVRGGYVGVGSDQNYTLFARARSEFVWLMDYDVVVIQAHRVYRALVLASPSPEEFVRRWDARSVLGSRAIIEAEYPDDPELGELHEVYTTIVPSVRAYFHQVLAREVDGYPTSWLSDPALYRYVRDMFEADRVRMVKGDLLGTTMLHGIARAHEALGVPMRVVYMSNAESYFFYNDSFRAAFREMPFDGESVVLRTISLPRPVGPRHVWHYQVEPAAHFLEMLDDPAVTRSGILVPMMTSPPTGGLALLAAVVPE